ncbi:hypothetical protein KSP40_PGU019020 [Platanthera guangdongensis]|uniref:Uncharacterized protein n=1 Tax=Platanthera guangdongensis TaxID=2320717 RepID=A0ABR2MJ07_9ASPA
MFSLVVATGENVWMSSFGELPEMFSQADTLSEEAEDHINESNNTQTFANEDLDSATPGQSSQSGAASKRKRKGTKTGYAGTCGEVVFLLRSNYAARYNTNYSP